MSTGNDISAVALAISLVALVISCLQAIQQYFSTAEGFRQRREDVMGAWSRLTESPLDLRNLRYETKFVSPHLMLVSPQDFFELRSDKVYKDKSDGKTGLDKVWPIGHPELPEGTKKRGKLPSARVSWLALLEHIEGYQRGLYNSGFEEMMIGSNSSVDAEKGRKRAPSMQEWFDLLHRQDKIVHSSLSMPVAAKRTVSWDFMPPEAMKPFATISLHDLLVLGHRLGLDWTDVRPQEDKLTAQDDSGNDISASRIRGLGLMIHFQHDSGRSQLDRTPRMSMDRARQFNLNDIMVPSHHADKLAFGVIPGDSRLGLDDVVVGTNDDCLEYVATFDENYDDKPRSAHELLKRSFDGGDKSKSGIDQLMALISPCLVLPGCRTTDVRKPNEWCHTGILEVMEGYVVFRNTTWQMLEDKSTTSSRKETVTWIKQRWEHLRDTMKKPFVWSAFRQQTHKPQLSTETFRVHDECTEKLVAWGDSLENKISHHFVSKASRDLDEWMILHSPLHKGSRRPMQTMLRFHLWRALALRERAEQTKREDIDIPDEVKAFPDAPMFCEMMNIQLREIDSLSREVVRHTMTREEGPALERDNPTLFAELVEMTGNAWLLWIFRALVFNRSCEFVTPRRAGAGGKQYSLIPAQWLYSQIPVHID